MSRKVGGRDLRQEPDEDVPDGESSQRFRVDRVYGAPRASSQGIPEAMPRARSSPSTMSPTAGKTGEVEVELALRHQLSKVQRQLADAQRVLATKEAELASEIEHRMLITAARDKLADEHERLGGRLVELAETQTRTEELERQLAESLATTQELAVLRERERAARAAAQARADELAAELDGVRGRGAELADERDRELERVEQEKQAALVAAGERMAKAEMARRDLEENVNTLALEISELRRGHKAELEALLSEHESEDRLHAQQVDSLQAEVAARRDAEAAARRELDEAGEARTRAIEERDALKAQHDAATAKLAELDRAHATVSEQLGVERRNREQAEGEHAELRRQLEGERGKRKAVEEERTEARRQLEFERGKRETAEKDRTALRGELDGERGKREASEKELAAARGELDGERGKRDASEKELAAAREARDAEHEARAAAEAEVARLGEQLEAERATLRSQTEAAGAQLRRQQAAQAQLEQALATLRDP